MRSFRSEYYCCRHVAAGCSHAGEYFPNRFIFVSRVFCRKFTPLVARRRRRRRRNRCAHTEPLAVCNEFAMQHLFFTRRATAQLNN